MPRNFVDQLAQKAADPHMENDSGKIPEKMQNAEKYNVKLRGKEA